MRSRTDLLTIRTALEENRQPFMQEWKDCADFISPTDGRWLYTTQPTNRSAARYSKIVDPTATLAKRALVAGLSSHMTNPARVWFRYTASNSAHQDDIAVKQYLASCEEIDRNIILKSNYYTELEKVYDSCATFGVGAMMIEEDDETVIRCTAYPIGSYLLGRSGTGRVDQFLRIYAETARNLVKAFGQENCSRWLLDLAKSPATANKKVDVLHYIGPNDDYDAGKPLDASRKKFCSIFMELGESGSAYAGNSYTASSYAAGPYKEDDFLRVTGYDYFPVCTPRWRVTGDDVYGSDYPGILARGHIQELQKHRRLLAQGHEKSIRPSWILPESTRRTQFDDVPGFKNYVDEQSQGAQARPSHVPRNTFQDGLGWLADIRNQIKEIFYTDLFLAVTQNRRSGTKALEIQEIQTEKTMLLPTLEKFSDELLSPSVEIAFAIAERRGLHPKPPPQLQGEDFDIEYSNILSTTLKMQGIQALDRGMIVLGQVMQFRPEVKDVIEWDDHVYRYLDALGYDPRSLTDKDKLLAIRKRQSELMQQQLDTQMQAQRIEQAKNLSETKLTPDSALAAMMGS